MKIEDRVNELLYKLENPDLKTREDADQFYRDWTDVVWNYKMSGKLFDYYPREIHVHRENGNDRHDVREIVKEVLALQAAFPDLKVRVEATVVVGDEEHGYQIWGRRYFNGTNLGYSKYGAPTGGELEDEKCMSLDMIKLEKINGRWQITNEYLMYSERTIRVAMGGPAEV